MLNLKKKRQIHPRKLCMAVVDGSSSIDSCQRGKLRKIPSNKAVDQFIACGCLWVFTVNGNHMPEDVMYDSNRNATKLRQDTALPEAVIFMYEVPHGRRLVIPFAWLLYGHEWTAISLCFTGWPCLLFCRDLCPPSETSWEFPLLFIIAVFQMRSTHLTVHLVIYFFLWCITTGSITKWSLPLPTLFLWSPIMQLSGTVDASEDRSQEFLRQQTSVPEALNASKYFAGIVSLCRSEITLPVHLIRITWVADSSTR